MAHDAVDGAPAHIAMKNTNMFKKSIMIYRVSQRYVDKFRLNFAILKTIYLTK